MAPDIITLHALSKDRNTTQTDLTDITILAKGHSVYSGPLSDFAARDHLEERFLDMTQGSEES